MNQPLSTATFLSSPPSIAEALAGVTPVIAAGAAARDRAGTFDLEPFRLLHDAGLLKYGIPEALGGYGTSLRDAGQVLSAVAGADSSVGLVLSMYYIAHLGASLSGTWPAALHEQIAAQALAGVSLINGAQSEPALGSPLRGGQLQTRATRVAEGWRIDGHKNFVTGSEGLAWYTVLAATDDGRIGSWLVPGNASGITIHPTWDNAGMRATATHDVVFDGVIVPLPHALDLRAANERPKGPGLALFSTCLNFVYLGIATAARDAVIDFLRTREPTALGKPLIETPRVRERLGRVQFLIRTASDLNNEQAARFDADPASIGFADAGALKLLVRDNVVSAIDACIQLAGGPGLLRSNPLERFYRDALCGRVHGPNDEGVLLALAEEALSRRDQAQR